MKKTIILICLLISALNSNSQNILAESFDQSTFPPSGWSSTSSGSLVWARLTSGVFPSQSPHSGAGEANFNSWYVSSGSAELVTSVFSLSYATGTNTISFWMYRDNGYLTSADRVEVYANTSATSSSGTLLGTVNRSINLSPSVSSNGWYQYTYTIPASFNSTTNYIIFKGTTSYGNDIFVDDVSIDHIPPNICSGTPIAPVVTTAAMAPASPLCSGSTKTITATDPNQPTAGITYQWQSSTLSTGPWSNVAAGSGATTLSYTTGNLSSSTWFRLALTCSNSSLTSYSAAYQVLIGAPQPGAITGTPTFCPGDPDTYSVPNVAGTVYTWTLPAGWSGSSSSNSILVTPGATGGTISVTANSSCGTSIAQTRALNSPGSAPGQPGNIIGNASVCANTPQTYTVTAVAGTTSYIWSLPSGWTGTSTTNSITTTSNSNSGIISVISVNGCGQSTPRTLNVTVINALANPGTITGPVTVCSGSLNNYSINPVPGATSYTWTFPTGWSGTTTGTSIQAFAGNAGGNVNVTAFVSCATSPVASLPIAVTATLAPSVSIATGSTLFCQGLPINFTATPTNGGIAPTYQWKKNGVSVPGAGSTYMNNSLATGDVISVVMTSNYACPATPTATSNGITANVTPSVMPGININTTPTINICAGTPLTFNTNITGGGTSPSYQWLKNGMPVGGAAGTGSSYTDAGLIDLDTITVQLTSNAICAMVPTVTSNKVVVSVTSSVVPSISISASSTILNGAPITFTATQSGGGVTPQYQWMKNNVDIPLATADNYTATGLHNGDRIAVKMLSYAPCANPELVASNEIIVTSPLSVASVGGWDGALSLYPNPNTGKFSIAATWGQSHNGKRVSIDILNAIGQNVYHSEVAPDRAEWHYDVQLAEALANGSYILRLSGDGMKATMPFTLNR
jgi:hypothetical protein